MPWLNIGGEQKRCYITQRGYFGFMTGNLLTAVMMSLPSDFQQCNILRHQEVHIGNPEYRPYRHQRALKNYDYQLLPHHLVPHHLVPYLLVPSRLVPDRLDYDSHVGGLDDVALRQHD